MCHSSVYGITIKVVYKQTQLSKGSAQKDTHPAGCSSGPAPAGCGSVSGWFHKGSLWGPGTQRTATGNMMFVGPMHDDPWPAVKRLLFLQLAVIKIRKSDDRDAIINKQQSNSWLTVTQSGCFWKLLFSLKHYRLSRQSQSYTKLTYTQHVSVFVCMLYVLLQKAGFKENMLQSVMQQENRTCEESTQGKILQLETQIKSNQSPGSES